MEIRAMRASTGMFFSPGLAKPVTVNTSSLSPDDAATLENLAVAAKATGGGPARPRSRTGRDMSEIRLEIDDGGKTAVHSFQLEDEAPESPLRALYEAVTTMARR